MTDLLCTVLGGLFGAIVWFTIGYIGYRRHQRKETN